MLADGWVIVNGARMRVAELDYLTQQLEFEYNRQVVERRSVVRRLIGWFGRR